MLSPLTSFNLPHCLPLIHPPFFVNYHLPLLYITEEDDDYDYDYPGSSLQRSHGNTDTTITVGRVSSSSSSYPASALKRIRPSPADVFTNSTDMGSSASNGQLLRSIHNVLHHTLKEMQQDQRSAYVMTKTPSFMSQVCGPTPVTHIVTHLPIHHRTRHLRYPRIHPNLRSFCHVCLTVVCLPSIVCFCHCMCFIFVFHFLWSPVSG